ncbi:enoyl-CoA hydratase/isomerase family protein [Nesterenkonia suensis]
MTERIDSASALITLNRAHKRNAMNSAARVSLVRALDATRDCKVVVLTGSGSAFCAGIDLKEAAQGSPETAAEPREDYDWLDVQMEIRRHPAVFIAAVNGSAMGGGMTLVNAADLAVCAEGAVFAMPEISFGLYPSMAGPSTQLKLGSKRASWMVLTGDRIDGRTAEAWGLVNRAVPADRLMDEALGIAKRLAEYDAVGLRYAKEALWTIPGSVGEWSEALRYGQDVGDRIREESDALSRGLSDFAAGRRSSAQGDGAPAASSVSPERRPGS